MADEEKRKLSAAWLNIVAAGVTSTGAVTQLAAVSAGDRVGSAALQAILTALASIGAGALLHLAARRLVGSSSKSVTSRTAPRPSKYPAISDQSGSRSQA